MPCRHMPPQTLLYAWPAASLCENAWKESSHSSGFQASAPDPKVFLPSPACALCRLHYQQFSSITAMRCTSRHTPPKGWARDLDLDTMD